jgi:hypothetical protein
MNAIDRLRQISAKELLALGLENVAYVRAVEIDGNTAIALCAADGAQIALAPDLKAAVAAAWENGLAPVTVH